MPNFSPSPAPYSPSSLPTLRMGSMGEAVRTLQTALNAWPRSKQPPLVTDANFGPKTGNKVREFQSGLRQHGVEWITSLEVGSLDTVARYVAGGFGIGLSLQMPRVEAPAGVRVLPLDDFPTLAFGVMWIGRLSPLGETFIEEAQAIAKGLK